MSRKIMIYIATSLDDYLAKGDGIPLFLNENPELKLRLVETHTINEMVELSYVRK